MADDEGEERIQSRISLLISCRLDVATARVRRAAIQELSDLLSGDSKSREILSKIDALKASSVHGYCRLVGVYLLSIKAEENQEILNRLCLRLTEALDAAKDPGLVALCRNELDLEALDATFSEISKKGSLSSVVLSHSLDWNTFVDAFFGDNLATRRDLLMCRSVLKLMSKDEFDTVGPVILQKLKAKPEKLLQVVDGFVEAVNPGAISSSGILSEYAEVLFKHAKSSKESVRGDASLCLKHLAGTIIEGEDEDERKKALSILLRAVPETKTFASAAQREVLYAVLASMAQNRRRVSVDSNVLNSTLSTLCTLLSKEAKSAVTARDAGMDAIVEWLYVAFASKTTGSGFDEAIGFTRKPVTLKNSNDVACLFGKIVKIFDLESLVAFVEEVHKDKQFSASLQTIIENANKKHGSSSVASIDGLVAVYLCLLLPTSSPGGKLPSGCQNALNAGSSKVEKTSFLFGQPMIKSLATNSVAALVLPHVIALYVGIPSGSGDSGKVYNKDSALVVALANCVTCPAGKSGSNASSVIESHVSSFVESQPSSDPLLEALFVQANTISLEYKQPVLQPESLVVDSQDGPAEPIPMKGKGSFSSAHDGMDVNSIRKIGHVLASKCQSHVSLSKSLIIMHVGSTLRFNGKQRVALISNTTKTLKEGMDLFSNEHDKLMRSISDSIADSALSSELSPGLATSDTIARAATSLVTSLGMIASSITEDEEEGDETGVSALAHQISTTFLPDLLKASLLDITNELGGLTRTDVGIFRTRMGSLYRDPEVPTTSDKPEKNTKKGRLTDDEEWDKKTKMEIAKKSSDSQPKPLSDNERKAIEEQDLKRIGFLSLISIRFPRVMCVIQCLAKSDIEVGNAALPTIGQLVLRACVLSSPAFDMLPSLKLMAAETLEVLAGCVYEISDEYASAMATALMISCRDQDPSASDGDSRFSIDGLRVSALPTPCEPAAVTVFEMDEFMEELSSPSFCFLFPVIQAALRGPRTAPGCEGALRVLERHTVYLGGELRDHRVVFLRRQMAEAVLELLKHDRAQTFSDPNPFDCLVSCYFTSDEDTKKPSLSASELAPLLDDRGALGQKNCRVGAMIALQSIAGNSRSQIKSNPLVNSRIWLNCFDSNESVSREARRAWATLNGAEEADLLGDDNLPAPSPMYAVPLLPLLSHQDEAIATAAAKAFATGMARHNGSVSKNIIKLCNTFIDACPAKKEDEKSISPFQDLSRPLKAPSIAPKKPVVGISTLKKKAAPKKSALQVAGIGQPKKTKKKSSAVTAALMKPKQERKLDQDELANQFKATSNATVVEKDSPAKVAVRIGVIRALEFLTSADVDIDLTTLTTVTNFLIAYGIADSDDSVKSASRNALRDVVASNGGSDEAISVVLPTLDGVLKSGEADSKSLGLPTDKILRDKQAADRRKEGAVVALGSVALHLKGPENAARVDETIDMLLASLRTPSEDVQRSVADCLVKLMKKGNTPARVETILSNLMEDCLNGDPGSTRRGAAHGIAAAVKGSGIAVLKKFNIVARLEEACASGNTSNKEGSLFAMELLCSRLGLLFEPYVIVLLPSLLKSFSDASDHVRKAASQTVGMIMSKLSAHGVKLVMPAVLSSFEEKSWRTKQASIAMLGSMSHLAPKQLASALPKVVPKLTEAYGDTHPKVKASAQEALDEITTVVKNPEISEISATLLKALTDPANSTVVALERLIETEFLHAIDAPSLALIVPILHRGLRDRGATTKRYGALIAGNICTMINDPRDFVPYIPTLIPDIKAALLDPIPDVRGISAKALGALRRGLGEDIVPDMRPWLLEKLRSEEANSAERSGAAQGLTEVLIASGTSVVEHTILEDLLPLRSHPQSSTREGVLWVLTFLPPALGQGFTPLLDASLPALIGGLSDENEQVRDVAMRAGRVLIKSHGKVHVNKILPILEDGMTDDDHGIRLSSLMLLGDLLSMIGGTTVLKSDGDTQDDVRKAERAQAQLTLALGLETRNRVLSCLYLARNDSVSRIRYTSIQIWKTIVSVTARTLRQILPALVTRVVTDLASGHPEKTEVAGKCLGDIVGKLGDSVLPEIIPVLRNALDGGDKFTRRGVCVGLSEVIDSSTKEQILHFMDIVVGAIQDALCDDDEDVRSMAAASFQSLHDLVGSRAMDDIVPALMVALESDSGDDYRRVRALNGLTGILSVRSRELLPYIVPRLIQQPITTNHAQALSSIAKVTGGSLYYHFNSIVPALLKDLSASNSDPDVDRVTAVRDCASAVFGSSDVAGVNWLVSEIAGKCSSDKPEVRRECCWMFEAFIIARASHQDFYEQLPIIIRELVNRFNDENTDVVKASQKAFAAMSKHVPAEELVKHVEYMRNLIASMVSDARRRKGGVGDGEFFLPAFNMPKGLEPMLPIYQRGILYGSPSIREASAAGLGEVITLTAPKFLAGPLVIKMTGPLLRVVGDRNPSNVKSAILRTLGLILVKGGPALRAFVPQFQTTFVKALSDPSRTVRTEAIGSLGLLMPLSTRVDPLLKELVSGSLGKTVATADSAGKVAVQTATLEALAVVLKEGGKKAKLPESLSSALEAGQELLFYEGDEGIRESAAKVVGAASELMGTETMTELLTGPLEVQPGDSGAALHGKTCGIRRILSAPSATSLNDDLVTSVRDAVLALLDQEDSLVKQAACVALGAAVGRAAQPRQSLSAVEGPIVAVMENSRELIEVHQAVATGLALALTLSEQDDRVAFFGMRLTNACLKLAMSGSQRVQFSFNEVLYLLLQVDKGDAGLERYASEAMFDQAKQMKGVYSKVLQKIKKVTILDG